MNRLITLCTFQIRVRSGLVIAYYLNLYGVPEGKDETVLLCALAYPSNSSCVTFARMTL